VTDAVEQLSCQELVELVTDYLEGVLPEVERARFDAHLATCDGCKTYVEQMRATLRVTGELTPASMSPGAEASLLEAFRAWRAG
jgi:anti-sigma factor RsiW